MPTDLSAAKQRSTARALAGGLRQSMPGRLAPHSSTMRYYDGHAQSYADATRSLPLHSAFEPFVSRLKLGASILDLGCGAGRDLLALSTRGLRAVGLDASLPLVELAAEYSGCPVTQGDIRSIAFDDETFAGIWASASMLHLRRSEIAVALQEVSRVLERGGCFFSSIKTGEGEGMDSSARWFTYFRPEEWLSLIRAAGFAVIESNSTYQAAGTLDRAAPTAWFDCTAQKR
jgi:SAM-dependent methyltransferase